MSRVCQEIDCEKNASFNYEGESSQLYCIPRKEHTIVNVGAPPETHNVRNYKTKERATVEYILNERNRMGASYILFEATLL